MTTSALLPYSRESVPVMPSANDLLLSAATSAFNAATSSTHSQNDERREKADSIHSSEFSPTAKPASNESAVSSACSRESTSKTPEMAGDQDVPPCMICAGQSTGIHFGVEACAACSAFFRRTVVLQKNYKCSKDNNCSITKGGPGGQKCRACRFKKCIQIGMNKSAVQHRRDAIGKFSGLVKRECPTPSVEGGAGPSAVQSDPCTSPPSPKLPRMQCVLDEIIEKYDALDKRRKQFYTSRSLDDVFDGSSELEPMELTDFGECMHQLWHIEPRLCAEFISSNRHLADLPPSEKAKIFKNFLLQFQAVEEPYLTCRYGGLQKKFWMMPNRTYLDFSRADRYFEQLLIKPLSLDKRTAMNLLLPSFQQAMEIIGERMFELNISRLEMIALCAVLMFDPSGQDLCEETRILLMKLRDQLFRDLLNHYEEDNSIEFPEVRLGNLLLLISGIKVHAQRTMENMQLLKIFDIIPRDKIFDEIITTTR